jgi:heme/copper-type cytochrome/quinol oxidase subunit 2
MRISAAAFALFALQAGAAADDLQTYKLELKGHKFTPAELHVPAAKPFWIVVTNNDDEADEFEMGAPTLEKMVQPGAEGRVRVRPLAPGRYTFFDDFHPDAQGAIVAE